MDKQGGKSSVQPLYSTAGKMLLGAEVAVTGANKDHTSLYNQVSKYFMSTACERPQGGGGQWTITSLPNALLLVHMLA